MSYYAQFSKSSFLFSATKITITLLLFLCSSSSIAQQWAGSTDTSGVIYRSGQIGINTDSPTHTIDVEDYRATLRLRGTGDHAILNLTSGDNYSGVAALQLTNQGTQVGAIQTERIDRPLLGATAGDVLVTTFGTQNLVLGTAVTERMRISATGNVGIGTTTPERILHVEGDAAWFNQNGADFDFRIDGQTDADLFVLDGSEDAIGIGYNTPLGLAKLAVNGRVGFGTKNPTYPLEMGSGAHVTINGVWTNASSRDMKDNIAELTSLDAASALAKLNPVTYHCKIDPHEQYAGFIAEEVPEIVATSDRKGLATMDIVAVLTRVVKDQQDLIEQQNIAINHVASVLNAHGIPIEFDLNGINQEAHSTSKSATQYSVTRSPSSQLAHTSIPDDFVLNDNFPNPFNPSTTIEYGLPSSGPVKITVYNSLGQLVKELTNEQKPAGFHQVSWDGTNDGGYKVSSGSYYYRIEAGDFIESRAMTMIK